MIHTSTNRIFPLEIGPDELWCNVKDAIKEKKKNEFADIDAATLNLWKVRHCAVSHVVMLNSQFERSPSGISRSQLSLLESDDFLEKVMAKNPLHPIDFLSKDLNDQLSDNDINIIIVQRSTRELLENKPITWLLTAHAPCCFSSHRRMSLSLVSLVSTGLDSLSTPRIGGQDSFTNGFQSKKGKKDFQDSIQLFLNDCHPAMETLVSMADHIPSFMASWTPSSPCTLAFRTTFAD